MIYSSQTNVTRSTQSQHTLLSLSLSFNSYYKTVFPNREYIYIIIVEVYTVQ